MGVYKWNVKLLPPEEVAKLSRWAWWRYKLFTWYNLQVFQIPKIAKPLYEEMYTRFASGDINPMRPRLCEPIYASLSSRIKSRPPNTKLKWQVHSYIGQPRVVSYKLTFVTMDTKAWERDGIQQAVVRFRSLQSLKRVKRVKTGLGRNAKIEEVVEEGSVGADDRGGKEVVEYLVLQKIIRRGKGEEWKIWGTTEETTLEKLPAYLLKKSGLSEVEE